MGDKKLDYFVCAYGTGTLRALWSYPVGGTERGVYATPYVVGICYAVRGTERGMLLPGGTLKGVAQSLRAKSPQVSKVGEEHGKSWGRALGSWGVGSRVEEESWGGERVGEERMRRVGEERESGNRELGSWGRELGKSGGADQGGYAEP
eukprot:1403487-Rhodomonas_salina.1